MFIRINGLLLFVPDGMDPMAALFPATVFSPSNRALASAALATGADSVEIDGLPMRTRYAWLDELLLGGLGVLVQARRRLQCEGPVLEFLAGEPLLDEPHQFALRYWKRVLATIEPEETDRGTLVEIHAARSAEVAGVSAHYDPQAQRLAVTYNAATASRIDVLGAILFESENAARGQLFRQVKAGLDARTITPVEYAGRYCAIEYDTLLSACNQYLEICVRGGCMGWQEWRSVNALYARYGVVGRPGSITPEGLMEFACSPHNPDEPALADFSFMTYLGQALPHNDPPLQNLALKIDLQRAGLVQAGADMGVLGMVYPPLDGDEQASFCLSLYQMIGNARATGNDPLLRRLMRWRVPRPVATLLQAAHGPGDFLDVVSLDAAAFYAAFQGGWSRSG